MEALALLERLVAFDTVSNRSNLPLIEFVTDYLARHGVEAKRVYNDDGTKANLYASVGPPGAGGVILSGHTDVVPVAGQPWRSDPFVLTERQGRLYGRGTADMKGFLALALAAVPRALGRLKRPLHLAFSYDEELGCLGAPRLIERLAAELPPVEGVIVGEPSSMRPVSAHKGILDLRTAVTGAEAHSSQTHKGVSAVMTAARLVTWLDDRAADCRRRTSALAFEPPYTTVHVGVIAGGIAGNIMARHCQFTWDVRAIPEDDPHALVADFTRYGEEVILPPLRRRAPQCAIDTQLLVDVPPLAEAPDNPALDLVRQLTGVNAWDQVAYAAEAGQFQRAGFAAVICGPGSIDRAHQPDEYLEVEQLRAGQAFMDRLIDALGR